jgi:hypothetical protein
LIKDIKELILSVVFACIAGNEMGKAYLEINLIELLESEFDDKNLTQTPSTLTNQLRLCNPGYTFRVRVGILRMPRVGVATFFFRVFQIFGVKV